MGNVCQNQRDQDTYKNREKSPKKLQAHMVDKPHIYNQTDPTQSEIREFMTDLNGESAITQQVLYMSSEFEQATQQKISIKDFRLEKVLGKGSFGKVMLVTHIVDEKQYAMKVLLKKSIKNERQKRHTMTERQILEKIDFPFIVKLHYAFQTNEKLYLVLDFMVGGELFHHLKKYGKFSEEITRFYAAQIVLGLEHLHELKIIYRDLKPENILLDAEGNLKLADFGLSKMGVDQNAPAHSLCGTPEYLAPEIIMSKNGHDKTVDWWSFGALVYEMLTGSPPFYSNNKKQMLQNIIYKPIPIPKNLSEKSKSLLQSLLVVNPNYRLGFGPDGTKNVKNHPFFANVDWEAMKHKSLKTPLNIVVSDNRDTKYFDPYLLKQQPIDTPASYNQDFFKFSQFTYNKKMEEVQMGEIVNNEEDDSNELFDLKGIGEGNDKKIENGEEEQDNSEIQKQKLNEVEKVIQDQALSQEDKSLLSQKTLNNSNAQEANQKLENENSTQNQETGVDEQIDVEKANSNFSLKEVKCSPNKGSKEENEKINEENQAHNLQQTSNHQQEQETCPTEEEQIKNDNEGEKNNSVIEQQQEQIIETEQIQIEQNQVQREEKEKESIKQDIQEQEVISENPVQQEIHQNKDQGEENEKQPFKRNSQEQEMKIENNQQQEQVETKEEENIQQNNNNNETEKQITRSEDNEHENGEVKQNTESQEETQPSKQESEISQEENTQNQNIQYDQQQQEEDNSQKQN